MPSLEQHFQQFRRTGDPDALAAVYDATAERLLRTALHLCGSPAEAEDVLQAAFVAVIEQRGRFDPERPLLPWLVGIVANQAKSARARARRAPDPDRLGARGSVDPLQQVGELEFTAAVDDAIDRLPEIYRSALVLHLRHGMGPADIAHALRRPPGTVRAQLTRGLEKLRGLLPAGIASMLVVAVAERGMAAVRTAVLHHASVAVPATAAAASAATLTGALLMKKSALVGVAVAAAALFVWSPWSRADDGPALEPPGNEPSAVAADMGARGSGGGNAAGGGDRSPAARTRAAHPAAMAAAPHPELDEADDPDAVFGVVLWAADGAPAAGVTVWCRSVAAATQYDNAVTQTDDRGRFRFAHATASAAVVGTARGGDHGVPVRRGRRVELRIPAGMCVRGVVRDGDGRPVAGAELWLSYPDHWALGSVVGQADRDGRFELRDVGTRRYLGARRAGFTPSRVELLEGGPGDQLDLEFTVSRGDAGLRGLVVGSDGRAVPGALVRIGPADEAPFERLPSGRLARGWSTELLRSAGDGAFEAHGLRPGALRVEARAPGHGVFAAELQVPAATVGTVRVELPAAASVFGRMGPAESETGWMVRVGAWNAFDHVRVPVDADGRFELLGVTPGAARVDLMHGNLVAARTELRLRPGERAEWNPEVGARPGITGVVVDPLQRPFAGAIVMASRGREFLLQTEVDADGAFALPRLGTAPVDLRVVSPVTGDGVEDRARLTVVERAGVQPGAEPVRIEVGASEWPDCVLRGRVLGDDGLARRAMVQIGHAEGRGVARVDTGDDGAFAVAGLVPGPYWIRVLAEGVPELVLGRRDLEPHADVDLGDLQLAVGAAVPVRLLLPPPAPGAVEPLPLTVSIYEPGGRQVAVVRPPDAAFETPLLPRGDYRLVVTGPGLAPAEASFAIGVGAVPELRLAVRPGRLVPVRVTVPADAPPSAWVAMSVIQNGRLLFGDTLTRRPDGSYAADLWVGERECSLTVGNDRGDLSARAMLPAGATGPVELVLRAR